LAEPVQIVIVADDLTGALDASSPFALAGLRCVAATGPAHLAEALLQGADVVAVSTNSRELPEAEAAEILRAVAVALRDVPLVFKKIDSRLKGHVAAEVAALAAGLGLQRVLLCPAIPAMGRVVAGGWLTGFGIVAPLDVGGVLAGLPGLTVAVPEAGSDAQIDAVLAQGMAGRLLVGARGLSAGLARRMGGGMQPSPLPLPRPIAFGVGSRDPITLAQVATLVAGRAEVLHLNAPNGVSEAAPQLSELAVMQVVAGAQVADSAQVTGDLARSFLRVLGSGRGTFVLTGGETVAAVLREMQIGLLEVLGEALPGLPLCRALKRPDAPLIVAKSGGFGGEDCFLRLLGEKG
jgi:D-threonate/D-erythronate kinase